MEILSTEEKEKLTNQISDLQSKLNAQNSYIDYANKNLEVLQSEKKAFSEKLETLTSEKQALSASLSDKILQLKKLTEEYSSLNEMYNETVSRLKYAKEENEQLQNQVSFLQQSLTDMENSHSWRLTKPLRAIKWWFRKIFRKSDK